MFWTIIILSAGVYLLFIGLSMSTKNLTSFLIFKLTPFLLGGMLTIHSLSNLGVI